MCLDDSVRQRVFFECAEIRGWNQARGHEIDGGLPEKSQDSAAFDAEQSARCGPVCAGDEPYGDELPSAVRIADRIAMLYNGTLLAIGTKDEIKNNQHPRPLRGPM